MEIKTIGVIGFGRFGRMAYSHLQKSKELLVFDQDPEKLQGVPQAVGFAAAVGAPLVLLNVPISEIAGVCQKMAPLLRQGQIVVDTCSVKEKPIAEMLSHLPESAQILGTHPLFGPDSGKQGIAGLKIALCPVRIEPAVYASICDCLKSFGLILVETSPQQHDQQIARSQAIFHLIAQTIKELQWRGQEVSTPGPEEFYCLLETVQHDTDQLFLDMEQDNPYAADCREKFIRTMTEIHEGLAGSSRKLSEPEF